MKENPEAQAAILAAVIEQFKSPDSPYVGENYKRLIIAGYEEGEVLKLLGSVLATEMWEISTQEREYDEKLYIDRLEKLPDTTWMGEE